MGAPLRVVMIIASLSDIHRIYVRRLLKMQGVALAAHGFLPVAFDDLSRGHADFVRWGPLVQGVRAPARPSRAGRRARGDFSPMTVSTVRVIRPEGHLGGPARRVQT